MHKEEGFNYHLLILIILNRNATRYTASQIGRRTFHEFEGAQALAKCQYHNGWGPICQYLTKEDKEPLLWGEDTLEQIEEIGDASRKHQRAIAKGWTEEVQLSVLSRQIQCQAIEDFLPPPKILLMQLLHKKLLFL